MKNTIAPLLLLIIGVIVSIFGVIKPYGYKILIHVQNHCNLGTQLDLVYCVKQLLYGLGLLVIVWVCIRILTALLVEP